MIELTQLTLTVIAFLGTAYILLLLTVRTLTETFRQARKFAARAYAAISIT